MKLVSIASRKTHGEAGPFDLKLGLNLKAPRIEPRLAGEGASHSIVFTFDKSPVSGWAIVMEGNGQAGNPTFSGKEMTVPILGVWNMTYATLLAEARTDCDVCASLTRVGFLCGDVNGDGAVTQADMDAVEAQMTQPVTAANAAADLNTSGQISVSDKLRVYRSLGAVLPQP